MAKFCPHCGLNISEKVKYCPECGADIDFVLGKNESPPIRRKSSNNRREIISLEIFACLIVLFLGLGLIYYIEFYPVGQVLGQDVTISQLNTFCQQVDQIPLVRDIIRENCDSYNTVYSWGSLFGYLFIVSGVIFPFVILYLNNENH